MTLIRGKWGYRLSGPELDCLYAANMPLLTRIRKVQESLLPLHLQE
jgi:hypothetical protein